MANATSKSAVRLDLRVAVPLSVALTIAATLAFTGVPRLDWGDRPHVFKDFRLPRNFHDFLDDRLQTTPLWLYQGLHAGPAILWCIGIPLQHVDDLRRKWPAFHRFNGRLMLFISLLETVTGLYFIVRGWAYTHQDLLHIHTLKIGGRWVFPILWPTFSAGLYMYAPFMLYTLIRAFVAAKTKDFAEHRRWAVLHSITGYAIATNRVNMVTVIVMGNLLALLPEHIQTDWLCLPQDPRQIAEAELSAFAAAAFYAYLASSLWVAYVLRDVKSRPGQEVATGKGKSD